MNLSLANSLGACRPTAWEQPRGQAPAPDSSIRANDRVSRLAADDGISAAGGRTAPTAAAAVFSEQAHAVDVSRSQSLQLEIMTAEGDRVTLTLTNDRALQLAGYQASNAAVTIADAGAIVSASGHFSYSVAGELSAEESVVIEALLGQVDEFAGRFFSGDIDGLLRQVNGFDLDIEELASFSLQMDMTRTVQVTSAYRSVQAMAADDTGTAGTSADLLAFISGLDAARSAGAGCGDLFDEMLKAAVQLLQPADAATTDTSAVALLDRLLSALAAAREKSAVEPVIQAAAGLTATG